jgi:N-hydroxyarylamine O-acetyltransferase
VSGAPDESGRRVRGSGSRDSPSGDGELDLDAYLARIGLSGRPALAELHRAHVIAIPFENLDPLRGVPISIQLHDIERKLVFGGRGGYCFEHNLLFGAALRALGMDVEPMLARVGPHEDPLCSLTHLLLRVRDGGALWHADVGFGAGTLLEPIPFGPGASVEQAGRRVRVVDCATQLLLQSAGADGVWVDLYRFMPISVPFIDIELSNWFTCTHPGSGFVNHLNVTVHLADGSRLRLSTRGTSTRVLEQTLAGETAQELDRELIPSLLADRFGLPGWTLDPDGVLQPAG